MDREDNQCEQRHFHCHTSTASGTVAPTVTIQPFASQSCAQANQSLDTVRSLHQTVVSLRNALDDARREISTLRKQMNVQTVIDEGKTFKENDPGHRPIEENTSQASSSSAAGGQKMGSQIDVKIRVSSNLNVSASGEGLTTMEESGSKSAPDSSRSVVNIKLTSQENLNVSQRDESLYTFNQATNEEVQLETKAEVEIEEVDEEEEGHNEEVDENEKSLSDGDNSVFDEPPKGEEEVKEERRPRNNILQIPHQKLTRAHSDTQEEVDDIELIFSSDDQHREFHEEEMVSISATYEPWQKPGSSGTPVLLSFEKLSLDEQERQTGGGQNRKQISLDDPREARAEGKRKSIDKSFMKETSLDRDHDIKRQQRHQPSLGNSKWQNNNRKELHVTDISKCGISEENIMDMGRRNTCPNPPVYRPILSAYGQNVPPVRHRNSLSANRCILGGKFSRTGGGAAGGGGGRGASILISSPARVSLRSPLIAITNAGNANESAAGGGSPAAGPKRSSSVQTDISALPDHWQSESHLAGGCYANGMFTLPSKFNPMMPGAAGHCPRVPLRISQKTQEARRVLLSDINFTSMIPELSRSADHLCPEDEDEDRENQQLVQQHEEEEEEARFNHGMRMHLGGGGNHLQTPNMSCYRKGLTPSASINSHGSMNESSFATQTTQTGDYWVHKGDSFDSTSCYTNDSRLSLNKSCRSRSVPSIKCVYCRKSHGLTGMRTSESMNYTPRVVAIPESYGTVKGSLPDLRHDCCCPQRYQGHVSNRGGYRPPFMGCSSESLMDDSEVFIRHSSNNVATPVAATAASHMDYSSGNRLSSTAGGVGGVMKQSRRCSENDIGRSYQPSKQSLPFLPKSAGCLKIGHLAKVIARNGRVVVGQVRYVGPICNAEYVAKLDGGSHDTFIGLELPANGGDTDGTIEGKRFFYCEQNHGIFVPFPKVIMAWTS